MTSGNTQFPYFLVKFTQEIISTIKPVLCLLSLGYCFCLYNKVVRVCLHALLNGGDNTSFMDFNSLLHLQQGQGVWIAGGEVRGGVSDPRSTLTNLHLILAEA